MTGQLGMFGELDAEPLEPPAGLRRIPECITDHGAHTSRDDVYRYLLWRAWGPGPRALFLLLNPSRGDAGFDDATIGRLYDFARNSACRGFWLANTWSYRATDPKDLWAVPAGQRVGDGTDAWIRNAIKETLGPIVVGWGKAPARKAHKEEWRARTAEVLALIRSEDRQALCLGTNGDGSPRHPLYLPGGARLELYEGT